MIKDDQVDEPIRRFIREQSDIEIDKYSDTGSNGELYFGKRRVLGDRVALKFYYYKSSSPHQEPLLLKDIRHENILQIFDAKIIDNQYAYFLTPEISGGDLHKFFNRNVLSTNDALSITQGILKGLSALHSEPNNIVHRDLKPSNILIDDVTRCPFIADFGSVRKIPEGNDYVVASKNTFIYQPVESLLNATYSKQSDIYQVGIILFQLLDGYFPITPVDWLSDTQRKKLSRITGDFEQWQFIEHCIGRKIIGNSLLDNRTLPPFVDIQLKKIINTATTPDLARRYKNSTEFLKALFDYSKGAIDWKSEDQTYLAKDRKGNQYRVFKGTKGYEVETKKAGKKWRRNTGFSNKLSEIISAIK